MALPLVGGDVHDWHWMLSRLGLLDWCTPIAWVLHAAASVAAVFSLVRAGQLALGAPSRSAL